MCSGYVPLGHRVRVLCDVSMSHTRLAVGELSSLEVPDLWF